MSDVKTQENAGDQAAEQIDPPAETKPKNTGNVEVPLRLERDRRRAAEAELQKLKDAQTKAEEDRLAEQGKFQELYEKTSTELEELRTSKTTLQERVETFEKKIQEDINTKIAELPEDDQGVVKMAIEGRDLDKQQEILNSLLSKFKSEPTKNVNVIPKGNTSPSAVKDSDITAKYKEAKKNGDVSEMMFLSDVLRSKGLEVPQ